MKNAFQIAFCIITPLSLMVPSCKTACTKGSGHIITEKRKVADFTKLDVSGSYQINLVQDSSLNISVAADDNLIKEITTEVNGDKLVLKTVKNVCASSEIVVTIGVHNLDEIKEAGAVTLNTLGKLVTHDLKLGVSGANKLNMELDAANLTTTASGSTELKLKGQASSHVVNLEGSGKVQAFDFTVSNYDLQTTGAGQFEINVLHELTVNSAGASTVKYKGNPTTINNKKSGSSTITKVN